MWCKGCACPEVTSSSTRFMPTFTTVRVASTVVFVSEVSADRSGRLVDKDAPTNATSRVHQVVAGTQVPLALIGILVLSQVTPSYSDSRDLSLWTSSSGALLLSMVPLLLWTVRRKHRYLLAALAVFLGVFAFAYFGLHWGEGSVFEQATRRPCPSGEVNAVNAHA